MLAFHDFFFINIQLSSYHKYAHIGGIMMHFVLLFCIIKHQTKIAIDDILIFYFYLSKKIRLDFSCESSA